jgi:hypothetical protein
MTSGGTMNWVDEPGIGCVRVSNLYKKYNPEKAINSINKRKDYIQELQLKLDKAEYNLYGSSTSPFYGLRPPSLVKIMGYLCDTYNVPYDVMMDMVYKNVMKMLYDNHLKTLFDIPYLDLKFTRKCRELKAVDYDYEDNEKFGGTYRVNEVLFKSARLNRIWPCLKTTKDDTGGSIKTYKMKYYKDEILYLGDIPYISLRKHNGNYCPSITIQSKRSLITHYNISDYEIWCPARFSADNHKYTLWKHYDKIRMWKKQDIIEQLNKHKIKFRLSMTNNKLMNLLMKE